MRVADLLRRKGSSVVTLPSTATVSELLETLDDNKIGAVVVVDDGQVVGLVNERDVVHQLRRSGETSAPLRSMMPEAIDVARPGDDLTELAILMTERRHRHMPVVEDGALRGIVSIGDVVKARLDSLQAERDALENYLRQ
jgi:CBS domain-containing protein